MVEDSGFYCTHCSCPNAYLLDCGTLCRYYARPAITIQKAQNLTIAFRFITDIEKIPLVNLGELVMAIAYHIDGCESNVACAKILLNRGGSGIKEVVRPTIVAHCGRRCPEALCVLTEAQSADLFAPKCRKCFSHVFLAMRKRSRSIKMAVLGKKRP